MIDKTVLWVIGVLVSIILVLAVYILNNISNTLSRIEATQREIASRVTALEGDGIEDVNRRLDRLEELDRVIIQALIDVGSRIPRTPVPEFDELTFPDRRSPR